MCKNYFHETALPISHSPPFFYSHTTEYPRTHHSAYDLRDHTNLVHASSCTRHRPSQFNVQHPSQSRAQTQDIGRHEMAQVLLFPTYTVVLCRFYFFFTFLSLISAPVFTPGLRAHTAFDLLYSVPPPPFCLFSSSPPCRPSQALPRLCCFVAADRVSAR